MIMAIRRKYTSFANLIFYATELFWCIKCCFNLMNSEIDCAYISNLTVNNGIDHCFVIGNTIDVWQISISQNQHAINNYKSLLSADELARAGRYLQQKDRERFITSRAALRILLGKYLNIPATEVTFHLGENKKPFVNSS